MTTLTVVTAFGVHTHVVARVVSYTLVNILTATIVLIKSKSFMTQTLMSTVCVLARVIAVAIVRQTLIDVYTSTVVRLELVALVARTRITAILVVARLLATVVRETFVNVGAGTVVLEFVATRAAALEASLAVSANVLTASIFCLAFIGVLTSFSIDIQVITVITGTAEATSGVMATS